MGDGKKFYTKAQLLVLLELPLSTFDDLRRAGRLPFLEELRPRLGKHARYRADLVDRYLTGQWNTPVHRPSFGRRRTG
jgi:hypothetical protein